MSESVTALCSPKCRPTEPDPKLGHTLAIQIDFSPTVRHGTALQLTEAKGVEVVAQGGIASGRRSVMSRRRKFSDEYKRETVRLATQPGVTNSQVGRALWRLAARLVSALLISSHQA